MLSLIAMTARPAMAMETVAVMADGSMSVVMAQLARDYSKRSNVMVSTSFASAADQQQQISEGAAADVLITPRLAWIETLKTQGLVDIYSQAAVARNRLALIAPVASPLQIRLTDGFPTAMLIQQFGWEPSFIIGSPDTLEEGVYGKEALRNMGVSGDLEEYTLYIKQLNTIFDMVANQGMFGLVFYSSTVGRSGIRVLDLLPENTHRPIEYDAVAIAGDNMEAARKFLAYLQSDSARAILRDQGFLTN